MVLLLIQPSNLSAQEDAGRPEEKRPERHDMSDLPGVSEAKAFHESLKTLSPEQKREAIRQWQEQRAEAARISQETDVPDVRSARERDPAKMMQARQRFYQSLPEEQRKVFQERDQVVQEIRTLLSQRQRTAGAGNRENVVDLREQLDGLRTQLDEIQERSMSFVDVGEKGVNVSEEKREEMRAKWLSELPAENKEKIQEMMARREEWNRIRALPDGSSERQVAIEEIRNKKSIGDMDGKAVQP